MEENYLALLKRIRDTGNDKTDRTGVGTRSIFGAQLRFDLAQSFPLLTTKKIYTKAVFGELCWLIRGSTNIKWLQNNGVHIWDEWADENGDLGPVYGAQWRAWPHAFGAFANLSGQTAGLITRDIDQLQEAANLIRRQPDSRRIVVSAWNVGELEQMALMPCHALFQFEVHDNKLSCHMFQRSADVFLGVPFNIASYAALTHYMAWNTKTEVGDLIISFGDVHIYNNHFDQVDTQLMRKPRPFPKLEYKAGQTPESPILDIPEIEDFVITGYAPYPAIKAEVAV